MKKTLLIAIVALIFALSSCHDVIFDTIRDEVELSNAQVSGDINSLVRYTLQGEEYLFVQNGNIYYKKLNDTPTVQEPYEGNWVQAIESGMAENFTITIAADSTYLYALGGKVEDNNDSGDMEPTAKGLYYSTDGNNWTKIDALALSATDAVTLFCTNSVVPQNRVAFVRTKDGVYALNGNEITNLTGSTDTIIFLDESSISSSSSAAYFNSSTYISATATLASNETPDTEPTLLYRSDGAYLQYTSTPADTESWTSIDIGSTVYAIAQTEDYVLVGTKTGLVHVKYENAVPTVTADAPTNAESTLSSYYRIYNIVVINPALPVQGGDIYGTTVFSGSTSSTGASYDNVGLWAYYPGRGNWNRE